MSVIAQLVLGGVFCGNQSNCRNCRICILIRECWNGVEPWRYWNNVEFEELPGEAGRVMNDWNVWNVSGVSGATGVSGKTGKTGMSGMSLEGLVGHTDAFLEDLLAFYA